MAAMRHAKKEPELLARLSTPIAIGERRYDPSIAFWTELSSSNNVQGLCGDANRNCYYSLLSRAPSNNARWLST